MEAGSREGSALSPSLLESIDVSKPLEAAYDKGMASWISTEYEVDVITQRKKMNHLKRRRHSNLALIRKTDLELKTHRGLSRKLPKESFQRVLN